MVRNNPYSYLPSLANALNNLANLFRKKNEFEKAKQALDEVLTTFLYLVKQEPNTYSISVARTAVNISLMYLHQAPNKDKSIDYALLGISWALPYQKNDASALQIIKVSASICSNWGINWQEEYLKKYPASKE